MAGVRRTKRKDGTYHPKYRGWYIDCNKKRRWFTGTTKKGETLARARELEDEHRRVREGFRPPTPLHARSHPYEDVLEEYLAWGEAQGGRKGRPWAARHLESRKHHLPWWQERLGVEDVSDLMGMLARVERVLRDLRNNGRTGKTINLYAESLKAFCDWCVNRGCLEENPLKCLQRFDATPATQRRALTPEEIQRLLAAVPAGRRRLYGAACTTGLRAGELRALRVKHLDIERGCLLLEAEWTKNRKSEMQPLPTALLEELEHAAQGRAAQDPLLDVPASLSYWFNKDLEKAGIPRWTEEGKVDFHALRGTYATLVLESGATVKEAQALMRHANPALTMNVYARTRAARLHEVVDKVGTAVLPRCATFVQRDSESTDADVANTLAPKGSPAVASTFSRGILPR